MSALVSTLRTDGLRYIRSPWVWALMLAGPIFARVFIPGKGDATSVIVVNDAAPILTSATLGLSLGVVVSSLLFPLAYIFLRAGPTRKQPWQLADITPASRIKIALGHWLADAGLFAGVLAGLSIAGCILGFVMLPTAVVHPAHIIFTLWVVAFPSLILLAGLRTLFASVRFMRGGWGDFGFFIFWMTGMVAGGILVSDGGQSAFFDYSGAFAPIVANATGSNFNVGIGASPVSGKTVALDVLGPMLKADYLGARLFWCAVGGLLAALGGALYQSHILQPLRSPRWYARYFTPKLNTAPADISARAAPTANVPLLVKMRSTFDIMLRSKFVIIAVVVIALAGVALPYRTIVSPVAALLLIIVSTAHVARFTPKGMQGIMTTLATPPLMRHLIDFSVIVGISIVMGIPAQLMSGLSLSSPLILATSMGVVIASISIGFGIITRSAFAGRLVLLIIWYIYISLGR
jgi:hypothetical protein